MAVSGQNIFWFFDTGVDRWKFHTLSPSLSLSYLRLERQIARIIVENVFWIFLLLPDLPLNVHNLFFNLRFNNENLDSVCYQPKFADFSNKRLGFNPKNAIFFFEFIIFAKSVVTAILLQQNFFIIIRHRCIDQQRKTEKFSITPKLIYVPISFGRMFRLQWLLRTTYLGLRGSTGPSSRSACSIVWTFSVGRFDRHIDFLSQTFEHFYWCNEVHRQRTSTVSCSLCQNPRLK